MVQARDSTFKIFESHFSIKTIVPSTINKKGVHLIHFNLKYDTSSALSFRFFFIVSRCKEIIRILLFKEGYQLVNFSFFTVTLKIKLENIQTLKRLTFLLV